MTQENLEITPEMNLEEFSRGVKDMLREVKRSSALMDASLKSSLTNAGKIVSNFQKLAAMDVPRAFQVDASGVAREIGLSADKQSVLNSALEESAAIWDRKSKLIDATASTVRLTVAELNNASGAVKKSLNPMRQVEQSARRLKGEVKQVRGELVQVKPVQLSEGGSGGSAFAGLKPAVMIAGAAAASKFAGAVGGIGPTVRNIGTVVKSVGAGLDQFRLAATAPMVNPQLNAFANGIRSAGNAVTSTLEMIRGSVAAIASDPTAAFRALQDGLNGIVTVGFDAVSTLAKLQTEGTRLRAVGQAFGFSRAQVDGFLQTVQGGLLAATSSGSEALAKMNGATHALGDGFRDLSGQSAQTAFAQEHLNKVAHAAVTLGIAQEKSTSKLAAAWRFLKTPYTVASEALALNTRAVREFREGANQLPPRLRFLTKALFELNFATRPIRVGLKAMIAPFRVLGSVGVRAFNGIRTAASATITAPIRVASSIKSMTLSLFRGVAAVQEFRANNAILRGEMTRLEAAAFKTGTTIKNVFFFPKNLLGGLIRQAGGLTFALKAAAGAAVAYGIKSAVAAESTLVRFKTMLRSGEQATALMKNLEKFAAFTPFSKDALVEGAQQLLTAQVPVDQMQDKLRILGDIAAGTGKPIREFARIYAKAANTGKVSQETLNQFAERGVPIYQSLSSQLGVSRQKMLEMIRGGKVGFSDLEAAITSTATGSGLFAGGMKNLSETTGGLFSTLKDNFLGTFKDLGAVVIEAFRFKTLLSGANSFFLTVRSGMAGLKPVVTAWVSASTAAWRMLQTGASAVLSGISTAANAVFGGFPSLFGGVAESGMSLFRNLGELAITYFALAEFGFSNWKAVGALAFTQVQLSAVTFYEDFKHFFGVQVPAALGWFGDNWFNIFNTALSFTKSVLVNLGTNIKNAFTAIWNFISSGGTEAFQFAWTPLLDGFENTIEAFPEIATRALSATEKVLVETVDTMKTELGKGAGEAVAAALAEFDKSFNIKTPELKGLTADQTGRIEEGAGGESGNENKSSGGNQSIGQSLNRGDQSTLQAIFNAQGKRLGQKQLSEAKKQTSLMKKFVSKEPVEFKVLPGVT